jgi:hypothetical protein
VSLIAVHRLLIQVFVVAALVFAWTQLDRWRGAGGRAELIGAIVALVLAVAAAVYLFRAPYLRRK